MAGPSPRIDGGICNLGIHNERDDSSRSAIHIQRKGSGQQMTLNEPGRQRLCTQIVGLSSMFA